MIETINHSDIPIEYLQYKNNSTIMKYEKIFGLSCGQHVKIIVTKDIYSERLSYCTTDKERAEIEQQKESFAGLYGQCWLPSATNSNFYVVLPQDRYQILSNGDDMRLYVRTIFHELTHVEDFYHYKCQMNLKGISVTDTYYDVISFFSEIRAKQRGETGYLDNFLNNKDDIDIYLQFVVQELNTVIDYINQYNIDKVLYHYARFLGLYLYMRKRYNGEKLNEIKEYINQDTESWLLSIVDNPNIMSNFNDINDFYNNVKDTFEQSFDKKGKTDLNMVG